MSKPGAPAGGSSTETVKVMVRCRPMNTKEKTKGCMSCLKVEKGENQINIIKPDEVANIKSFAYDAVYDTDSLQQVVYDESAFPLVESVIEGYNGTIFAYGQTGCGKTHTMLGTQDSPGIIPGCFKHIFGYIDGNTQVGTKFLVRCSYLEIYNEEIHDLLVDPGRGQPAKLELKEDPNKGVFVKDLNCLIVKSIPEIEKAMNFGTDHRKVAETQMNATSSRSHSIFTIYIETGEQINGEQRIKAGKLNLVDLAGSERANKTGATGATLKEGIKINLSLTALGNVISALVDGKSAHVPYRDSKLTRLLQDSLGGNTKTVMIAAVSPADYNYEETLSTLRYAARAKAIKNKPRVNEDPKDALLKEYEDEIKKLKEMLLRMSEGKSVNVASEIQQFKKNIDSEHIMMDVEELRESGSPKKTSKKSLQDETVEDLIAKLESKGKKVVLQDQSFRGATQTPREDPNRRSSIDPQIPAMIQDELKSKEQALEQERQQKEQLASLIQELEKKLVTGGQTLEEREREQAQKQREMQLQLRLQKKKEKQLQEEKRKKEEEMLLVEKHYKNLQEEVDDMRNIIRKLREKYKASQLEIEDLQRENQYGKEDLLETIRELEKDLKFANNVMKVALSGTEIEKIRGKSHWDENRAEWRVPTFVLNNSNGQKEVQFPTINGQQRANHAKENRELNFEDEDSNSANAKNAGGYDSVENDEYQPPLGKPPKAGKTTAGGMFTGGTAQSKASVMTASKGQAAALNANLQNGGAQKTQTSQNFNNPGGANEIPDRRKKYLQSIEDGETNNDADQQQRRQRANVHLQPLAQVGLNNQNRNLSLPQKHPKEMENELMNQHPVNFAPSPNKIAPAGKPKLDRIDHENFRIQSQAMIPASGSHSDNGVAFNGGNNVNYANLPSPTAGKRNKQLEPLGGGGFGGRGL